MRLSHKNSTGFALFLFGRTLKSNSAIIFALLEHCGRITDTIGQKNMAIMSSQHVVIIISGSKEIRGTGGYDWVNWTVAPSYRFRFRFLVYTLSGVKLR